MHVCFHLGTEARQGEAETPAQVDYGSLLGPVEVEVAEFLLSRH